MAFIISDTFFTQNHILRLLKLDIHDTRKYRFLSFNSFLNEISKIKNLETRVAVNNWNKCESFRKKWHRIKNKAPLDLIGTNKRNHLFMNLQWKGGWNEDLGGG